MKKALAVLVVMLMLCALCACDSGRGAVDSPYAEFEKLLSSGDYRAFENRLVSGDLTTADYLAAYKLLVKKGDVTEAKKLLSNFYFFPTEIVQTDPVRTYIYTYTFDDAGNLTRAVRRFSNVESTDTYTYAGNTVTLTASNSGAVHVYTLDDNGNCIKEETKNTTVNGTVVHTYDVNGNRIKTTTNIESARPVNIEYTYDTNGNCIKKVWAEEQGSSVTNIYTYDAHGNLIKDEQSYLYTGDAQPQITMREYTYDADQRLIKEKTSTQDYSKETTHTYDGKGNRVREQSTQTDAMRGKVNYDIRWEFDEHGHFMKQVLEEVVEGKSTRITTATVKGYKVFYIPNRAPGLDAEILPSFGQNFILS